MEPCVSQPLTACRSISHHITLKSKESTLKNRNYYTRHCFLLFKQYMNIGVLLPDTRILIGLEGQLERVMRCRIIDWRIKAIDSLDWLTFKARVARTVNGRTGGELKKSKSNTIYLLVLTLTSSLNVSWCTWSSLPAIYIFILFWLFPSLLVKNKIVCVFLFRHESRAERNWESALYLQRVWKTTSQM